MAIGLYSLIFGVTLAVILKAEQSAAECDANAAEQPSANCGESISHGLNDDQQQEAVNAFKTLHHHSKVQWSNELAIKAQAWVNQCDTGKPTCFNESVGGEVTKRSATGHDEPVNITSLICSNPQRPFNGMNSANGPNWPPFNGMNSANGPNWPPFNGMNSANGPNWPPFNGMNSANGPNWPPFNGMNSANGPNWPPFNGMNSANGPNWPPFNGMNSANGPNWPPFNGMNSANAPNWPPFNGMNSANAPNWPPFNGMNSGNNHNWPSSSYHFPTFPSLRNGSDASTTTTTTNTVRNPDGSTSTVTTTHTSSATFSSHSSSSSSRSKRQADSYIDRIGCGFVKYKKDGLFHHSLACYHGPLSNNG